MIVLRRAADRGRTELDWLDSRHTFSFGGYTDERWTGFRKLRVVNDDRVAAGGGFGTHGHRDMEIISYVVEGRLAHEDSLGTGSVIVPGEVQRMSAGSGVRHSEHNASQTEAVRFLQIWIVPERAGIAPSYEQRAFPVEESRGALRLVAARDGREGALTLHEDVAMYVARLSAGERARLELGAGRGAWVQVVRGALTVNGERLAEGDGAGLTEVKTVELTGEDAAEVLVFDLA